MANRLFAPLCSWLITCFTVIRFLNIFQRLNTIRSNLILVLCLTIIFSVANSYVIVSLGFDGVRNVPDNDSFVNLSNETYSKPLFCHIREEYVSNRFLLYMNTLVVGFLNLALPSIITAVVNVAIVCYIKRIYKVKNSDPMRRRSDGNAGINYRSTRSTLLVISITYTLCYLPYCLIHLLLLRFNDNNRTLSSLSEITFITRYISHSVNFYAYIFTNHRFRRDIIYLFRSLARLWPSMRTENVSRTKTQTQYIIFRRYAPSSSTPSYETAAQIICNYQRPACIRFQNNIPHSKTIQHSLNPTPICLKKRTNATVNIRRSKSNESVIKKDRV